MIRFYSKVARDFYPSSRVKIFRKAKVLPKSIDRNAAPTSNAGPLEVPVILEHQRKPTLESSFPLTGHLRADHETVELANTKTGTTTSETSSNPQNGCSGSGDSVGEYAENAVRIQMISRNLHRQIFADTPRKEPDDSSNTEKYTAELKRFGIDVKRTEHLAEVELKLPPLRGRNIEEHFYSIAKEQVQPYESLLLPLVSSHQLPARPKEWVCREGWTAYDPISGQAVSVECPEENALVLDVEVCMTAGAAPTLATAVSTKRWYSWVSNHLTSDSTPNQRNQSPHSEQKIQHYTLEDLIPLGAQSPKIVIGHNVSYDRARLREQYLLEDTGARFLDTMSLHVCVSGVTSYQRALMKSKKEPAAEDVEWLAQSSLNSLAEVHRLYCGGKPLSKEARNVFMEGTLSDVRKDFQRLMDYCANDVEATHRVVHVLYPMFVERFPHPATLAGMLEMGSAYLPVNRNWLRFITESDLAYEDLNIEAKYHLSRRADEACALLREEQYKKNIWLWDEDWSVQKLKLKQTKSVANHRQRSNVNNPSSLPTSCAELSTENLAEEERLRKKFQYLLDMKSQLPARRPLLPGYPAWYRKLCQKLPNDVNNGSNGHWSPGPTDISTGMQIAPKLLSLCWEGFPLHYTREHGWGFLVPFRTDHPDETTEHRIPIEELVAQCPVPEFVSSSASEKESAYALGALRSDLDAKLGKKEFYAKAKKDHTKGHYKGAGVWCNEILEGCCYFLKLPHKNGKSLRVGNPLSRDFLNKFSENVLSSGDAESGAAARVIEIARMMSYWRNNRDRIIGQKVVWVPSECLPKALQDSSYEYGAICPQVVVCGTLTRRAMEPTWMTASNSQIERIGSELRAMVQAPPGYRIVGADVDSQELWIASVLGDAYACGIHGATPLGWMTLSGNKSNGTDMHSITAQAVGISRDHAKVINYARIYGAGQNFAEGLLKQFNPTFSDTEARSKAVKMFTITKGKRVYTIRDEFEAQYGRKRFSGYEALQIASSCNRAIGEMFHRPCWVGGTESAMFNRLEEIATSDQPVTPFLGCRLSRALETNSSSDENRFLPTRINWVVQSGAVDFLHLMLVSMRWLLGPYARFCLSFHDELRYMIREEYAYKAALAMHITNLLTRSFCASRLGLPDLPMSVAFFSSVEVDTVLRKECTMDCRTPSNPHGLKTGYGIVAGESLNIHEAIRKAGGNDLTKWDWIRQ